MGVTDKNGCGGTILRVHFVRIPFVQVYLLQHLATLSL